MKIREFSAVLAVVTLCTMLFFPSRSQAQDPAFTQFYANPLYLNPAFAGTHRCPRFSLNYRNQWPNITGTYVTYSAAYDQHFDALSGGLGFYVLSDDQAEGTLKTQSFSAMYSYELPVNRFFSIRMAAQATFFQRKLDWNRLTFGDMIDNRFGFIYPTGETPQNDAIGRPDFAVGFLGFSEKYFIGIAGHHLHEPNQSFLDVESKLPRKYTLHAGAVIPVGRSPIRKGATISPNILVQQQQDLTQLNLGVYLNKGALVTGLWYRNQDAFILLVGLQAGVFRAGYSYDVTISNLSRFTAGSHEVSASWYLYCRPKKRKFRTISCPSF